MALLGWLLDSESQMELLNVVSVFETVSDLWLDQTPSLTKHGGCCVHIFVNSSQ